MDNGVDIQQLSLIKRVIAGNECTTRIQYSHSPKMQGMQIVNVKSNNQTMTAKIQ